VCFTPTGPRKGKSGLPITMRICGGCRQRHHGNTCPPPSGFALMTAAYSGEPPAGFGQVILKIEKNAPYRHIYTSAMGSSHDSTREWPGGAYDGSYYHGKQVQYCFRLNAIGCILTGEDPQNVRKTYPKIECNIATKRRGGRRKERGSLTDFQLHLRPLYWKCGPIHFYQ
jgi:hypothetical protein